MNCRRVQRLIPLYVEGDLRSNIANRVASHLEWCGRCNWLTDEYKDSQSWLRSEPPPEFDDAYFEDLKHGVMKRISQANARHSPVASIARRWGGKWVLALSTALLIALGMVALYFYQARSKVGSQWISDAKQSDRSDRSPVTPGAEPAKGDGSTAQHRARKETRNLKARNPISPTTQQTIAHRGLTPKPGIDKTAAKPANQTSDLSDAGGSKEMLRIEIQTGDPSIRIIWFAPKGADLHQSKPATD